MSRSASASPIRWAATTAPKICCIAPTRPCIAPNVTAATALPAAEGAQLTAALERRFNRRVRVQSSVDPSLIGGAVVRAGDLTIDGSVKARLARLARELIA